METMQFHITKMDLFLGTYFFFFKWPNWTIYHQLEMLLVVQYRSDYPMGTSLSNDFALLLKFINIHKYTNEIIFIQDHKLKDFVKLYH